MRITQINQNKYNYSPADKGNMRIVKDKDGKVLYRTTTYYFRQGLDWNKFSRLLASKYEKTPKVNIIDHACSSGAEAYTLVMMLITKFGEGAKKFYPIIAKDLNKENIEMAKNNEPLEVDDKDFYAINYFTKNNLHKFLDPIATSKSGFSLALRPKEHYHKNIQFAQGNVFDDIEKADSQNTVFFCRNFWPYLSEEKRRELAQKLSEKFDETSLVIIGEYDDIKSNAASLLLENGFVETSTEYVYTKPGKKSKLNKVLHFIRKLSCNNNKPEPQQISDNKNSLA